MFLLSLTVDCEQEWIGSDLLHAFNGIASICHVVMFLSMFFSNDISMFLVGVVLGLFYILDRNSSI